MEQKHYQFAQNELCEYFPCHKVEENRQFNCLFCYCPLYALGKECGGHFRYNEKGIKDCTNCTLPHDPGGYEHVMKKIAKVLELAKQS